ncbi:hypothetical protein F5972_08270 [Microbispora cellulosiformans]|uniref:Uncharacterized protein n=1 Tax=Microbispora cellulosiformans TaxID=2614688 RepID=A0A5J5K875_9ACTN|nr:hypothetical protein [Microbispora cellulosiformans]KAA9379639.1 hypothetical protein F5972_08270 [Microbispora cellulosiformans]
MNGRSDVARRFPFVARARPACHRLDIRVRQVADLADAATGDPAQTMTRAAEAHNLAALIASDCGLPALAADLCWTQFAIFHTARPYTAAVAKLALQPLINLGRLHARTGHGTAAHHLITTVFDAVKDQTTAEVDGRTVDLTRLAQTPEDHRELVQWLWAVVLSDGTRALTQACRWAEALQHVQAHHGLGQRLLDGRQIAIITHHATGDCHGAARLLAASSTPTPWEQAVAAALAVLTGSPDAATMVDRYLGLDQDPPGQVVFRVRLGLAVLDLAAARTPRVSNLRAAIIDGASSDAYAARDVLGHHVMRSQMTPRQEHDLTAVVTASGLGAGTLPPADMRALTTAVDKAEVALRGQL